MPLTHVFWYRLDVVAFVLLAVVANWLCCRLIRRRRPGEPLLRSVGVAIVLLVLCGAAAAEWAGKQRRASLVTIFSGIGPTYAYELQQRGHAGIGFDTAPDDPRYLAMIEAQKNWLRVNPLVSDVYTFRYDHEGNVRFVVDSETDYDGDGAIRGEREERTPIGELYAEATEDFHAALHGERRFDLTFVPDRWGTWVSSLSPIYDESGRVEAAVGIDYPGAAWLHHILAYRAVALAAAMAMIGITLAGATIGVLLRAEIRERIVAQQQLRREKHAADLASRAKSEFISVMSHEIRSPLTALIGYASILRETPLNPTQQRYARTVADAADRLNTIVSDVLDLTRMEEGRLTVEAAPFAPVSTIREVVDSVTGRALEKGLALEFTANGPDSLAVLGDSARLRQVVAQLLSNAIKFTDHGSIVVEVSWRAALAGAGELVIRVKDTGVGISSERLGRIFETFSALESPHGRRRGSRGVGLALCKRLLELMGGTIVARSEPGRGSEFIATLPCRVARSGTDVPDDSTVLPAGGSVDGPRVLLAGHESLTQEIVQTVLRRSGYSVLTATGLADLPARVARERVAALVIDISDIGGEPMAVVQRIRAAERLGERIPIVALADEAGTELRRVCLEAGVDECLSKPVYMPAVLSALSAFLRQSAAAPALEMITGRSGGGDAPA